LTIRAALLAGAHEKELEFSEVTNFHSVTGKGIMGTVGNKDVALGTRQFLEGEIEITSGKFQKINVQVASLREEGQMVLFGVATLTDARLWTLR